MRRTSGSSGAREDERMQLRGSGMLLMAVGMLAGFAIATIVFIYVPSAHGNLKGIMSVGVGSGDGSFWSRRPANAAAIWAGEQKAVRMESKQLPVRQSYSGMGLRRHPIKAKKNMDPAYAFEHKEQWGANMTRQQKLTHIYKEKLEHGNGKYAGKGPDGVNVPMMAVKGRPWNQTRDGRGRGGMASAAIGMVQNIGLAVRAGVSKLTLFPGNQPTGLPVIGGLPAFSRAGRHDRKALPTKSLNDAPRPKANRCHSCPRFITYAIQINDAAGHPVPGTEMQQFVKFPFDNSTDLFMSSIQMVAVSLATTHSCFKLTVYTDDDAVVEQAPLLRLGQEVKILKMPAMPQNPYDSYGGRAHGKNWNQRKMSAARWKLDLIDMYLDENSHEGKVIWMDLGTLVAQDMSCLYEKNSHFVYTPNTDKWGKFSIDVGGILFGNISKAEHLVFDDLFMADKQLLRDAVGIEAMLEEKQTVAAKSVSSYLSMMTLRPVRKMVNLAKISDSCWGYQYMDHHHHVHIANNLVSGEARTSDPQLHCTLSCKPVGAMSFSWKRFQSMRWLPCSIFGGRDNGAVDTGAFDWFKIRYATAYKNLTRTCGPKSSKKHKPTTCVKTFPHDKASSGTLRPFIKARPAQGPIINAEVKHAASKHASYTKSPPLHARPDTGEKVAAEVGASSGTQLSEQLQDRFRQRNAAVGERAFAVGGKQSGWAGTGRDTENRKKRNTWEESRGRYQRRADYAERMTDNGGLRMERKEVHSGREPHR